MKLQTNLIEKAAQHALSEVLGYDEGRAYYLFLTKRQGLLDEEYSYSKKYRILKNLFNSEAMGKIKSEEKDSFVYILLPPSFLHFNEVEIEIIEFLEEKYFINYTKLTERSFIQLHVKSEAGLVVFLLKHMMKESAKLVLDHNGFESVLKKIKKKVLLFDSNDPHRKIGLIDNVFAFEFSRIMGKNSTEYIGYIAKQSPNGRDYIAKIRGELRTFKK